MPLKVLWFDNTDLSIPGSGQVTKTTSLLKALNKYLNITLICPCKNPDKLHDIANNIIILPSFNKFDNYFSLNLFRELLNQIRKDKYNAIIYSHIYGSLSLLPFRLANIPIVYDCHGIEYELIDKKSILLPLLMSLEFFAMKMPEMIIVMSEYDKKIIKDIYKVSDRKITVIPPQRINNQCTSEEKLIGKRKIMVLYNINVNTPIILFHGNLKYGPNAEAVNIIVNKIAPKLPQYTFLIVGPGAPLIGKINNVIFTGFAGNLREIICAADAAIVPILTLTGVNMKIMDYVSHGIPVIVTPMVLRWLNPNDIDGSFYVAKVNEFPEAIEKLIKIGGKPTRWKRERSIDDVVHDYISTLRNLL